MERERRKVEWDIIVVPIIFLALAVAAIVVTKAGCDAVIDSMPAVSDTVTDKIEPVKEIDNETMHIDNEKGK